MAALYPSQAWCDEWKNAINESRVVQETGKNWGVDFNGNWVFEIAPGAGLEKKTYVYIETKAGHCSEVRILEDPSEVEAGFLCTGTYEDYKDAVKGKKDFIEGVVRGTFKLQGDMGKIMRNARFIRAVADSFSSFESEYLGE